MNDFARDNELKTRGNRVGLWSLVKTSVLDQKRMCVCGALAHVRFGSKADMCSAKGHCPLYPQKRTCALHSRCLLWAKSGHRHIHTGRLYGFMANAQKPLLASSANRAFTNPALTSVFVRPSLDWPE